MKHRATFLLRGRTVQLPAALILTIDVIADDSRPASAPLITNARRSFYACTRVPFVKDTRDCR